jgi:large subunit ribosomal protein L19
MQSIIKYVENRYIPTKRQIKFHVGDTITVYTHIIEGSKIRIQSFKGVVIQIRGKGYNKTFTVRKTSENIGVERIYLISNPSIQLIDINKLGKVSQSRIFFFRKLKGKKAKIKEKKTNKLVLF